MTRLTSYLHGPVDNLSVRTSCAPSGRPGEAPLQTSEGRRPDCTQAVSLQSLLILITVWMSVIIISSTHKGTTHLGLLEAYTK